MDDGRWTSWTSWTGWGALEQWTGSSALLRSAGCHRQGRYRNASFSDIFISPLIDKLTGTAYVGPVVQEVLVGKLGSFDIPGLLMWFNSLDHRPFHFHAKKTGKWELRIFFLECSEGLLAYEAKWSKPKGRGPSARDLRLILDQVLRHREELLKEWESKVKTEGQP